MACVCVCACSIYIKFGRIRRVVFVAVAAAAAVWLLLYCCLALRTAGATVRFRCCSCSTCMRLLERIICDHALFNIFGFRFCLCIPPTASRSLASVGVRVHGAHIAYTCFSLSFSFWRGESVIHGARTPSFLFIH